MRAATCHNGWPGCFLVRWGALSKNLAYGGTLAEEGVRTPWQVRVIHCVGVIFTPSELAVSRTVSSTRGRPCWSLRRGFNAPASPHPLRLQWRHSRAAATIGEWRYEPIFPDPEMCPLE